MEISQLMNNEVYGWDLGCIMKIYNASKINRL